MNGRLRQYLIFSRAERMGLVALGGILLLLIAWRTIGHFRATGIDKSLEGRLVAASRQLVSAQSMQMEAELPEHQDKSAHSLPIPDTVDINTADSATLVRLIGIGPATSHRILVCRTQEGPFTSVDQLRDVGSFTRQTLLILSRHLRFASPNIKRTTH